MWKKSHDFSQEELEKILQSPQARMLSQMLQQMDPAIVSRAAALASQGDAQGALNLLGPVLNDPHAKEPIQNMEDSNG